MSVSVTCKPYIHPSSASLVKSITILDGPATAFCGSLASVTVKSMTDVDVDSRVDRSAVVSGRDCGLFSSRSSRAGQ